jgi:hypothetical protein
MSTEDIQSTGSSSSRDLGSSAFAYLAGTPPLPTATPRYSQVGDVISPVFNTKTPRRVVDVDGPAEVIEVEFGSKCSEEMKDD